MVEKEDSLKVTQCSPKHWPCALKIVFGHLDAAQGAALVAGVCAGAADNPDGLSGLLVAVRDDVNAGDGAAENGAAENIVGAIWVQLQPGAAAVVWPPGLTTGEAKSTSQALMQAAVSYLQSQRVCIAQCMLERETHPNAALLKGAEFAHFVDLVYLMAGDTAFPNQSPAEQLNFVPYQPAAHDRLASVVQRTYENTKDCPQLNGVRKIDDVLAGYKATGVFDPAQWLLVQQGGQDVGCLLLADHPGADQWELVYMGVVPESRGAHLGLEIVRYAQWLTAQSGRPRLVLAVDASNRPAIDMYTTAGFQPWDRRSVFLRVFEEPR